MAEKKRRRGGCVECPASPTARMEADMPMNRYIGSILPTECPPADCGVHDSCPENRLLLEQLVELSAGQTQLLVELLGAVNSLTAALLTMRTC